MSDESTPPPAATSGVGGGVGAPLPDAAQATLMAALTEGGFSVTSLREGRGKDSNWADVREQYPSLGSVSDVDLDAAVKAYIDETPSLADALFKTPIGPVLIINLVAWAFQSNVCDLPFVPATRACAEAAARLGK